MSRTRKRQPSRRSLCPRPAKKIPFMAIQLTAEDARQSLTGHVEQKGIEVFGKFGPQLDWDRLQLLLEDRAFVRYPVEIVFDATPFQPGEIAHPVQKGEIPEEGFTMFVHPAFETQRERAIQAILYQLVVVNYGDFASPDEAETFGAAALGLTRDEYYAVLCGMSDEVGGTGELAAAETFAEATETPAHGCGGGCTCG